LGFLPAPAQAQVQADAVPVAPVNGNAPADAEHDAALLRLVQAINFYPYFRRILTPMFTAPEQPNDPALERFLAEVVPESWVNEFLVKLFSPGLADTSSRDLDEAARFFRTPTGQKYVALQMHLTGMLKDDAGAPVKLTSAEKAAFNRFARSPGGIAFSHAGSLMSSTAVGTWGEQAGKQRMLDILKAAQAKYTVMSDSDFQAEADKLHGGGGTASPVAQIAIRASLKIRPQFACRR